MHQTKMELMASTLINMHKCTMTQMLANGVIAWAAKVDPVHKPNSWPAIGLNMVTSAASLVGWITSQYLKGVFTQFDILLVSIAQLLCWRGSGNPLYFFKYSSL